MKLKFILSLFFIIFLCKIYAQNAGITTNAANINIASGTSLVIPGNVKIIGTGDYIFNNGTCYIAGNFTNGGSSFNTTATGTEIFNGVSSTISATTSTYNPYFNNFTIASGASVILSNDINILNNWTNNSSSSSFIPASKTVTFRGTVNQTLSGNTTFYDLTENQTGGVNLIIAAAQTIINHNLTISGGTMSPNINTLVEFTGTGNLAGGNNKVFYDLQIDNTSAMTITNKGVSIAHNFVNNGTYKYNPGPPTRLTTFNGSGVIQSFTASVGSLTDFDNLTIGNTLIGSTATTLNASGDFTISGGSMSFNTSSKYVGINNTATFSTAAATVSGTGTANFYNAITNVGLDLGGSISTITNNLQLNSGGSATTAPIYGSSATLTYNTASAGLNTSFEWSNNTSAAGGAGTPKNVSVLTDNIILLPPASSGSRTVPGTLNLNATATLAINGNTLTVNSGFAGTGKLRGSVTSNLIAGGTGTINFDPSSSANYLKGFAISSGADLALGNALNITASNGIIANTFGIVTAIGSLNANGNLTLKSDVYGDAIIGQSLANSIRNNVTVERFVLGGKRAWRFLSVPVNNGTSGSNTINYFWQENNTPNPTVNIRNNIKPGYGTEITYLHGDNSNGFDENITANSSIKYWDVATGTGTFLPVTSTNIPINTYPAYCLFVRGSRDVDLSGGIGTLVKDNTILRTTGTLNVGAYSKNYNITSGNRVLISNPYAAPIDIIKVLQGNNSIFTQNKFWIWDPFAAGSYNVGGYVTYASGFMIPTGSTYNMSNIYSQSGQAFMAEATTTSLSTPVSFTESNKYITTEYSVTRHRQPPYPAVFANLMLPSGDSLILVDGIGAAFSDKFSAAVDEMDAAKVWNFDENMASVRDTKTLAMEFRPMPQITDTLFLRLYLRLQPYALKIFSQNMAENFKGKAWLIDEWLNTQTEVNLFDTTLYNFTPTTDVNGNADTNSYRNRFMLVYNREDTIAAAKVNSSSVNGVSSVNVFPNPVIKHVFTLQLNNLEAGRYEALVYDSKGQLIINKPIQHASKNEAYKVVLPSNIAAGLYKLILKSNGNIIHSSSLVVAE